MAEPIGDTIPPGACESIRFSRYPESISNIIIVLDIVFTIAITIAYAIVAMVTRRPINHTSKDKP